MIFIKRNRLWALLIIGFFIAIMPNQVFAHATLIKTSPAPHSQHIEAPSEVSLTFNESMEKSLFYIKVLNSDGDKATNHQASMSQDQKQIHLDLPSLTDGIYTITYKAISADGHPVGGSYVISIGEVDWNGAVDHSQLLLHRSHHSSHEINILQLLMYLTRIMFYISFLLLVGWTFWKMLKSSHLTLEFTKAGWFKLKWMFTISLFAFMATQIYYLIEDLKIHNLTSLFLQTGIGLSWLILFILILLGFFILHRSKWIDGLWIILMLFAKSMNGHAIAFDPAFLTIILDMIHLLAAAVWVGGLFYIVLYWKKNKASMLRLLPVFSNIAFLCIIILSATGILTALLFLPNFKYLLYTQWGLWLMVKVSLVIIVIIAGLALRYRMKRDQSKLKKLLYIDFISMLFIVVIVSIFTYLNPLPANTPLDWHEMGSEMHMTVKISPNSPGSNHFQVLVWILDDQENLKRVQLHTASQDEEMYPIDVPLTNVEEDPMQSFPGFKQFNYVSKGPYLPFAGSWEVQVRIMDANDEEKVYKKIFQIY